MSFTIKQYLEKAVFHTGSRCPVNSKKRVCYRTYHTDRSGIKFVSHVHLGKLASDINWSKSDNILFSIYDYCLVQDRNVLIDQAKTVRI
jgi:hypothetical protein